MVERCCFCIGLRVGTMLLAIASALACVVGAYIYLLWDKEIDFLRRAYLLTMGIAYVVRAVLAVFALLSAITAKPRLVRIMSILISISIFIAVAMACFNLTILWRNRGNFNDKCVEKVQELNGTAYNPGTHWLSGPFKRQLGPGTGAGGTGSGTTSGSGAGTGSGTTPGSGAGTGSGTTPGSGAGTGGGTTPGSGAGTGSGTTPGSGAGTGNGTTTPGDGLQSVAEDEVRNACKHAVLGFLIFATVLEAVMLLWTFYFSSIISRYAEQLKNQSKTYPHHRLKSEITSTKGAIPAISSTISRSSTSSDASNDNDEKRNPRTDL